MLHNFVLMNSQKFIAITLAVGLMAAMGSIALAPTDVLADQRNNLANKNEAGDNTQKGLVNLGNTQVGANVGANVCALAEDC